jgi:plasmid stability protein
MTDLHQEPQAMASLTVRGIPEAEKEALRVRAAKNGRSMEAELRAIIREAVKDGVKPEMDLFTAIRAIVEPHGGLETAEHPDAPVEPPRLD